MKKITLFMLYCLTSTAAMASNLPDFQITKMWMDNSCSHVYVTFMNKGAGIDPALYDRSKNNRTFFMMRGNRGERQWFLDEVDPNRRMTHHDGVATFELTNYIYLEKNTIVSTMVNYGLTIEESKYGAPNYSDLRLTCSTLPVTGEEPLDVTLFQIVPNSGCSIAVGLKNPGPNLLTMTAWNTSYGDNITNGISWDNYSQGQVRLYQFDPEKKLRNPGGRAVYTFDSKNYHDPFKPGDTKEVRFHGYWVRANPKSVYDVKKKLGCGPDLVLHRGYSVQPENPRAGDTVTVRFIIKNDGTDTAPPSEAALKFGGETRAQLYEVPEIKPGGIHVIRRSVKIDRAGSYLVKFKADNRNQVLEYDESNNSISFSVTVR
jgi:hypothetical protein